MATTTKQGASKQGAETTGAAPAQVAPAQVAPAQPAPAEAPAPVAVAPDAPAANVADVLADFRVAPARKVAYEANPDAARAHVPALRASETAPAPVITRGKHTRSGVTVLMLVDGASVTALPLAAIGAAIAHGVVSREEITALLGAS